MRTSLTTSRPAAWTQPRLRVATPLLLALLVLLTRLPLRSRLLYHWDSINFAFALERFDIAEGQPHAPGYLLYVLLGRAAAWLSGDAQRGFVLLAILGSVLAVVALHELGRRLWDERTGTVAALLLLSSPLFWFYGEIALPHTLDALLVIVAATLCWRVWSGENRIALLLALWLGLAGGVRQQSLVFLLPLAIVACWRLPWRIKLGAALLLLVVVLAWLLPLFALTGGMTRYLAIVRAYAELFDRPTSLLLGAGWAGLRHNLDKLMRYTAWAWAIGSVPALLGIWLARRSAWMIVRDRRCWLLALWAVPCLLFYTLIHMGQQGLIFVYLPILLLLSARGALAIAARWRWGYALIAACILGNGLLYLFAPATLLPGRLKVLSQATIREQDRLLAAQIAAVRSDLPPNAALLADEWRFPQYYLPDVTLIRYRHTGADAGNVRPDLSPALLAQIREASALAWYEPLLDQRNHSPERVALGAEQDGVRLRVLTRAADERFWITADGFGVERIGR
jgi:hypothetical protein